jgi:hypothetical protein
LSGSKGGTEQWQGTQLWFVALFPHCLVPLSIRLSVT